MNTKKIKELIDLMNDNDLSEIEIDEEGSKIKLVKKNHGIVEQIVTPSQASSGSNLQQGAPANEGAKQTKSGKEIKAPMVGTFYRAPSPDEPPYVQVGDIVAKGDVLCIVEAMKLMNEVKADFGGRIIEICCENAEPVEFGQTIFVLEAA